MSTAEWNIDTVNASCEMNPLPTLPATPHRVYHRVRTVRIEQGMSIRSLARRMKISVLEAESLEQESSNMLLSTLHKFSEALEVPLTDLLVEEEGELSDPIHRRAQMVRIMKTAGSIKDKANNEAIRRMSTMLIEQLCEIMPELREVSPWHTVGQRRSSEELGRMAENPIPDDFFTGGHSW